MAPSSRSGAEEEAGADIIAAAAVAVAARRTTGGSNVHSRPSTRCRPASLPRRSSLPAGGRSRPRKESTDPARRNQKGGRQGEREETGRSWLEATLEEDWPGRNLVWWACGRRDEGGHSSEAHQSSTVAVINSCLAPDEIKLKLMACFAKSETVADARFSLQNRNLSFINSRRKLRNAKSTGKICPMGDKDEFAKGGAVCIHT